MADTTTLQPEVVFDDNVLAKIASNTAQEVDGVLSLQGNLIDDISNRFTDKDRPQTGVFIDTDDDDQTVGIELTAVLAYGKNGQEILNRVAEKIAKAVKSMTGYQVTKLKMVVKDMLTMEEWRQQNDKQQNDKQQDDKQPSEKHPDEPSHHEQHPSDKQPKPAPDMQH